jgi:hypothetical protein
MQVVRRRRLAAGQPHAEIESELTSALKMTPLAALAFFDDKERGGDVMKRLNQFGPWAGDAFRQCKEGGHEATTADLNLLIIDRSIGNGPSFAQERGQVRSDDE